MNIHSRTHHLNCIFQIQLFNHVYKNTKLFFSSIASLFLHYSVIIILFHNRNLWNSNLLSMCLLYRPCTYTCCDISLHTVYVCTLPFCKNVVRVLSSADFHLVLVITYINLNHAVLAGYEATVWSVAWKCFER